jgi:WD40 repeat protein
MEAGRRMRAGIVVSFVRAVRLAASGGLIMIAAVCAVALLPWLMAAAPAAAAGGQRSGGPAVPGARVWVSRYNGPGGSSDSATSMAVSPDGGTVFVTGFSAGVTSDFDYATVAYRAATGAQLWASRYNGPGNGDDEAVSVAVSPGGGTVFVTGYDDGGGFTSKAGYATVAYNAATGTQLWASRYHGPGQSAPGHVGDEATSLAVSPSGSTVFVTGFSAGVTSGLDYATIAYNAATGAQLWASRYNGPASGNDLAHSVAVSPGGTTVYVTGRSPISTRSVHNAVATVAYNAATGAQRWVSRYDGTGNGAAGFSVAAGPAGRKVYVTGYAKRTAAFSSSDFVSIAYNAATGAQRWVSRYNGPAKQSDFAISVTVGPGGGTVFVTGNSDVTIYRIDYATVAYNAATGAQRWARRYRGHDRLGGVAFAMAVSPDGRRVYVTGYGVAAGPRGGPGGSDYATVAYRAATGAQLWARRYDGPAAGNRNDIAYSVAVSPGGRRVYVAGDSIGATSGADYATIAYKS